MNNPLKLYHLPWCPFCIKVRRAADELDIALELVDISEDRAAYDLLLAERGRATVPLLGIASADGERLMPESDDIIRYLRDNADHLAHVA